MTGESNGSPERQSGPFGSVDILAQQILEEGSCLDRLTALSQATPEEAAATTVAAQLTIVAWPEAANEVTAQLRGAAAHVAGYHGSTPAYTDYVRQDLESGDPAWSSLAFALHSSTPSPRAEKVMGLVPAPAVRPILKADGPAARGLQAGLRNFVLSQPQHHAHTLKGEQKPLGSIAAGSYRAAAIGHMELLRRFGVLAGLGLPSDQPHNPLRDGLIHQQLSLDGVAANTSLPLSATYHWESSRLKLFAVEPEAVRQGQRPARNPAWHSMVRVEGMAQEAERQDQNYHDLFEQDARSIAHSLQLALRTLHDLGKPQSLSDRLVADEWLNEIATNWAVITQQAQFGWGAQRGVYQRMVTQFNGYVKNALEQHLTGVMLPLVSEGRAPLSVRQLALDGVLFPSHEIAVITPDHDSLDHDMKALSAALARGLNATDRGLFYEPGDTRIKLVSAYDLFNKTHTGNNGSTTAQTTALARMFVVWHRDPKRNVGVFPKLPKYAQNAYSGVMNRFGPRLRKWLNGER